MPRCSQRKEKKKQQQLIIKQRTYFQTSENVWFSDALGEGSKGGDEIHFVKSNYILILCQGKVGIF